MGSFPTTLRGFVKSLQDLRINSGNSVIVIVDAQNEFLKPGGKWYSETSAQIAPGVISAIRGITERARNVGIPIIYIQSVRTLKELEFTVFGREPNLELGTWGTEIVEELKPLKEDIIVHKYSHDPFFKTEFDEVLERLVPDPTKYYAIVTGGAINVCVYHTLLGFYLRNYWTVVLVDSIFYSSPSGKQTALEQLSWKAYPSIFLSRSDLVEISNISEGMQPSLIPGS